MKQWKLIDPSSNIVITISSLQPWLRPGCHSIFSNSAVSNWAHGSGARGASPKDCKSLPRSISASLEVRNLGVTLDSTNIKSSPNLVKFYHWKNISRLLPRQKLMAISSIPPISTAAMVSCSGSPVGSRTGSCMCKTQLQGFSPTTAHHLCPRWTPLAPH